MENNNKNYYKNHNGHNNGNKFYYKNNKKHNKQYYYHKNNKKQDVVINKQESQNNILLQQEPVIEEQINQQQNQEIDNNIKQDNIVRVSLQEDINSDYEELEFVPIKKSESPRFRKRGMFKYALGALIIVALIFGASYSFFTYTKEDTRQADIYSGEVYVKIEEEAVNLSLSRMYPRTNEEARSRSDNYIDFTLKGKNTSETKEINYVLNITNGADVQGKTRINPQYLLLDLQEKVGNEYRYIKNAVPLSSFSFSDVVPVNTTSEITKEYRLRIWVSDAIIISDTEQNRTYTQAEFSNLYANVHIEVNSGDRTHIITGEEKVRESITAKINATTNSCNPIWVDDNGTTNDETDDITYFSGTNDCVDMNYVWYSGKLWRITSIYPDGTMKLITEDNITTISWGSDVEYDGSWVYQWLNEDFYDTLYNANNIIEGNSTWNYSTDENSPPVKPETIETQKTILAPVGLLSAYEYYNSYRNTSEYNNYLNMGYFWWLITPYSTSFVRRVNESGSFTISSPYNTVIGVRPSIYLKSSLEFTGNGTKTSPYKIVGDKEEAINNTTILSSRSVGEYVKFDNDLYRIVDTENGITKLAKLDYLSDSGTTIKKNLSSSLYFGKSSNTQSDTYWDYYLNNTWYNNISSTYKSMLVDGTYYLGVYPNNTNYKATICKDATLDSVTTKNCTKYTGSDTDKTFTGKVGLLRVGEMFSSQLSGDSSSANDIWTITPFTSTHVCFVNSVNSVSSGSFSSRTYAVRPSITLKAGIKITGGTGYVGGDTNSPFEISE